MKKHSVIALFSMEIVIESGIPTYYGRLGVLAGEPICAVQPLVYLQMRLSSIYLEKPPAIFLL